MACAVATAATGAAEAPAYPVTMRGETDDDRKAVLTIDEKLRPQRAVIAWSARCKRGGFFRTATAIDFNTELQSSGTLAARGTYRSREGGYRFRIKVRMNGKETRRFEPDDDGSSEEWDGGFAAKVFVRGRARTTCSTKDPWEVRAYPKLPSISPHGSLHMDSDEDDHVGGGLTWDFAAPPTPMTGDGDLVWDEFGRSNLEFRFETWGLRFHSPKGQPFAAGTTYPAIEWGHGPGAGLDIGGDGRGCGGVTGEVTIHSISFDQWGDLIAAQVSFEQHCEGREPALTGTVSYNRGF
jgi:hypothetical protein